MYCITNIFLWPLMQNANIWSLNHATCILDNFIGRLLLLFIFVTVPWPRKHCSNNLGIDFFESAYRTCDLSSLFMNENACFLQSSVNIYSSARYLDHPLPVFWSLSKEIFIAPLPRKQFGLLYLWHDVWCLYVVRYEINWQFNNYTFHLDVLEKLLWYK